MSVLDDPEAYVGNPAFHQFIKCPRTGLRVSFSEAGPGSYPNPTSAAVPVLFFCLPSFSSRYIAGPHLQPWAERYGVRVVGIDRPGCGGTDRCELKDRVKITSELTQSVLEYLEISASQISLLSHSSGIIFALDLLARSPFFSSHLPDLYASSPWVPTALSPLRLIPSPLVAKAHVLIPKLNPLLQGIGKSFTTSAALFTATPPTDLWPVPTRLRPSPSQETELYRPRPPYHLEHTLRLNKQTSPLIEKTMMSEPLQGMSQDFMLCLNQSSKGSKGGVHAGWYQETVRSIAERSARQDIKVDIEVFWALNDGMISKKGRDWFDALFREHPDGYTYDAVPVEGAGHDDPMFFAETLGAVFERVRDRWEAKQ